MQWIAYEELVEGVWLERRWTLGKWSGRHGLGKGAKGKRAKQEGKGVFDANNGHVWKVHLVDLESNHSICGRAKMEGVEPGVIEQEVAIEGVTCMSCLEYAIDLRNAVRAYEGQLFRNWQQG